MSNNVLNKNKKMLKKIKQFRSMKNFRVDLKIKKLLIKNMSKKST